MIAPSVILLLAHCASPVCGDGPPLIVVPPVTAPPDIDGVLDDPAWESATEATGFVLNTTPVFAQEQTWVRRAEVEAAPRDAPEDRERIVLEL